MGFTTRILLPTDFSDGADAAIKYAIELARDNDAAIELLHAYQPPAIGYYTGSVIAPPAFLADLEGAAQTRLDGVEADIREAGVEVASHLVRGAPTSEITDRANAMGCDLIVMGTHGRSGLAHMFIGSVAERVVRTASVPVLTLRRNENQ